jgi:hypothetical protein
LKDIPRPQRLSAIRQHFTALEFRDPEKFRHLLGERDSNGNIKPTSIFEITHSSAYEAIKQPHAMLMVAAAKLTLNLRLVTPMSLARELKVSVATLYRRYGRDSVRQACHGRPVRDEAPAKVRYQINSPLKPA